jgi:hypothetical protein
MDKTHRLTHSEVLKRAKEKNIQVLDHENAIWLICPAGKVFDMGHANSHCQFFEYGTERSEFMSEALDSEHWHASFVPDFYPSTKTEAYDWVLAWIDEHDLIDCTEPECDQCYLRTNNELVRLMQYFCIATFGPQVDIPHVEKSHGDDTTLER